MALLTQKDQQSILKFLQELYISCNLEQFPTYILALLPQVVSSEVWFYFEMNFQSKSVSILSPSVDDVFIENLKKVSLKYFHEHPLLSHYLKTGNGQTCKISDFLSEKQLHNLEGVYWHHLYQLGMEDQMGFAIPTPKDPKHNNDLNSQLNGISFALHRPERSFSERDRLVLNLLRPHLLQAYQNAQSLTQMQQELVQLNRTVEQLGTITLTSDGKVQLMTQKAWMLLNQYFHTESYSRNSLPENLQRWVNHQIALRTQENDIPPCCPPLQLEHEGKRLSIRLIADQQKEQYLLLLEQQQITSLTAASLELLSLTKREAEVLFWVTQDKSDMEIASELGLSLGTIKKHLEHIYQKFGVHTRTSAIMYALKSLGMLN